MLATATRPARTALTEQATASDLHAHDLLVGTTPGTTYWVESVKRRGAQVTITLVDGTTYTVDAARPVTVLAERACDCGGRGTYSWGGSVNGVPAHTGTHFACNGKGWQSRQDVIRNATYWNKYARISY